MSSHPAIFLDRDGTLNVEKNYLYRYADWEWIKGSKEAILNFNRMGYLVVIVTNQAGIARGYYNEHDLSELHKVVAYDIESIGGKIDGFYYCPHHPDFGRVRECECRKPKPGLLLKAASDLNINIRKSYMIGDKLSDVNAGCEAGCASSIIVRTGYGNYESTLVNSEVRIVNKLIDSCKLIISDGKSHTSLS